MMEPVLRVENLGISYRTRQAALSAVRGVNFTVHKGQIVGLVGESGCGKSTVALALIRLLPPNGRISSGRLLFQDRDLLTLNDEEMRQVRGSQISMIFQDPMTSLNPVFSVEQQMVDAILAHPPEGKKISRREARERAVYMLDRVGIPDAGNRIRSYPHQFSGGMRQRIMIALALQSNPTLLIADEPTSALDVTLEAQITDLVKALREEFNTSILYITHDLGIVAQLCDEVIVLYAGNVVETGDVHRLFKNPRHPYTQALLRSHPTYQEEATRLATIPGRVPSLRDLPKGCKFAPRCEFAQEICFQEEPALSQLESQQVWCFLYQEGWQGEKQSVSIPLASVEATGVAAAGSPALGISRREQRVVQAQQVHVHFQDEAGWLAKLLGAKTSPLRAVSGVDIAVYRGETLAVVGESGSGKTTLGRTILGLETPTSGEIQIEGKEISRAAEHQLRPMRARMQMIFQDPISSLSPRKTVAQLLLEPFKIHHVPVEPRTKIPELLEMVGLSTEQADKYPHQLSGGQARRVGIARALALNPALLVADEPTAGLDVSVAAGILNLLKDLREQLGLTYILITHNLNVIRFIADRVAVMYLGKIVEIGETTALFTCPKHPYTEALMSAIAMPDPEIRRTRKRIVLEGEIPNPKDPPSGCPFHPRCRYRRDRCVLEPPDLRALDDPEHKTACHFPESVGSLSQ